MGHTSIRYLSLFSGIEAATVAWHPLGLAPVAFAEIEPFPSTVLAHHYPEVPNLGDVVALRDALQTGEDIAHLLSNPPDIVVGGSPCQAFSIAGSRQGLSSDRGNLTLVYAEIINAINPKFIVWENVPGVLSMRDNAFGHLLGALAGENCQLKSPRGRWTNAGAVSGPKRNIAWRVLDAQYFGVAQQRRRVFLVASRRDGLIENPWEILFEQEGVRRDTPPRRSTWQESTRTITNSPDGDTVNPIIAAFAENTRGEVRLEGGAGDRTGALSTGGGKPGQGQPCIMQEIPAVAGTLLSRNRSGGWTSSVDFAAAGYMLPVVTECGYAVRRLTPYECARLQGFPDDYLDVPYRRKPAADGPKYKALGNSMAVPVMRWIGERLRAVLTPPSSLATMSPTSQPRRKRHENHTISTTSVPARRKCDGLDGI